MTKVVLTQKDDSGYKDEPGRLYHFPARYLRAALAAIGDACLFYAPRRSSADPNAHRMSYWATAVITDIRPDPHLSDHYFADLDQFLEFTNPVTLQTESGRFWESKLDRDGKLNGGSIRISVRPIPDFEFARICSAGFSSAVSDSSLGEPIPELIGFEEDQAEFERPIVEALSSRLFRDRVFAKHVRDAYDSRCAVTGLKIINGGGRAEMEAAHIKPVAQKGPDFVRNGLALSRTVHWMFDRGLISVDDDFKLLKVPKLLPDGVDRLFHPSGEVIVPESSRDRPNPTFLRWHRENCFKG